MKKVLIVFLLIFACKEPGLYDLRLRDLSGREVSLEAYRGKTLVIYVWSGTCVGHTQDLKRLVGLKPEIRDKAAVVSVAVMMDVKDVKEVLGKNGIVPNYPVLADPRGELADRVTLLFLPATLLIDPEGKVVRNYPRLPEDLISFVSSHE